MNPTAEFMQIDRTGVARLAGWDDPPIASVYLPITVGRPADEFQVRVHSAAREIRRQLVERYEMRDGDAVEFTRRLVSIDPTPLLGGTGVAIFMTTDSAVEIRLDPSPGSLVEVGSSPNLLPLLPWFTDRSQWWVLGLSQSHVRLWLADRSGLVAVDVPDVPQSFEDTQWFIRREPGLNRHGSGMMHGTGGDRDLHKDDLRRHFRAVDAALGPVLAGSSAPLVVAAVEYEATMFIAETDYAHVVAAPLAGNVEHLDMRTLHEQSWQVVRSNVLDPAAQALDRLEQAQNKGRVATTDRRIDTAFERGQVEELLVAKSLVDPGSVKAPGADIRYVGSSVLSAIRAGSPISLVPDDQLPKATLVAALLRY